MTVRNLVILVFVLCVLCAGLSVTAYADIPDPADCNTTYNLCENCDIETDISGGSWIDTANADVSWSTAQSRSSSHSLKVTVTDETGTYGGESGCISLGRTTTTDDYYAVQAFVYASQSAIDALTRTRIRVAFYDTTNCSGGQTQTIDTDLASGDMSADSWNKVSSVMSNVSAGHQGAKVRLTQNNASASGSVSVYWDDVLFFQSNATAVTIRDVKVSRPEEFPSWTFGLGAAVLVVAILGSVLIPRHRA